MKTLVAVLIFLILAVIPATGETLGIKIDKLIEHALLDSEQLEGLKGNLNRNDDHARLDLLMLLYEVEYYRFLKANNLKAGTYLNFGKLKPGLSVPDSIKKELTSYLSKLLDCGLISENLHVHFESIVGKNEAVHVLVLLPEIIEKVRSLDRIRPDRLKVSAGLLRSKGVVSSEYDRLLVDIDQGKLQQPFDLMYYCDRAVVINTRDYPDTPEEYLEQIHKQTASVMQELAFTDFNYRIVRDSAFASQGDWYYSFVVELKSNDKEYKLKSYYGRDSSNGGQSVGWKVSQQEYYKIFNKVLVDLESSYRLHEVKSYDGNAVSWDVFGIIALTKEQAKLLNTGSLHLSPSYEYFGNTLTSTRIASAIAEYRRIGLLQHLTAEQIEQSIELAAQNVITDMNDILMSFPGVLHLFDMELGNLEDPYAELIAEYKNISHGEFNASEISDDFDIRNSDTVEIQFKIGNREFKKSLEIDSDWMDTDFFDFVDSVVDECKLNGRFYNLYTGDQDAVVIYLTKQQYEHLHTNKLLVFDADGQTEEE